jgi:hypothetical protein
LDEDVQHERNISTLVDDFGSSLCSSRGYALRFETQLRTVETAFNRAAGAASTTEKSRWAAKPGDWDGLTFDTKGEIIILSSAEQRCPQIDVVHASSCAFIHTSS